MGAFSSGMWAPQSDLFPSALPGQTRTIYHPPIYCFQSKYLRNHKHNNKFLTTMKPQSESCCLLRTRNLQMQYADNLQTSVGRSMQLSALCTQVERSRTKSKWGKTSHPLWINNTLFIIFSVTCVMQVMSVTRADTFTSELKSTRELQSETTWRISTICPQMTLREILKF